MINFKYLSLDSEYRSLIDLVFSEVVLIFFIIKYIFIIIIIIIIIIILFIVQCWTQASKPEPLKQDPQKEKTKINLYSKL